MYAFSYSPPLRFQEPIEIGPEYPWEVRLYTLALVRSISPWGGALTSA